MLPMLLAGFLQTASVIPYVTPSSGLTPVRVLVIVQSSPSLPAPNSNKSKKS